jgi:hypothetical protein
MTLLRRSAAIPLLVIACVLPVRAAQTIASPTTVVLAPEQMEAFLLNATIIRTRPAPEGVTRTRRATLSDGTLTHDAQIQVVDQSRALFEAGKYSEVNFKDSYRYNIAAYRLARLLELDTVPMSIEREVEGRRAAVTWWIDDVMMDEGDRVKKKVRDPNALRGSGYVYRHRVFDELIQNRDRNLGNLLYTSDWKMWMIDHTRAFRLGRNLLKPDQLVRIERSFFETLKKLTPASVTEAVGTSLTKQEIDALIARSDVIVKLFEQKIARSSEAAVLFTMPQ